MKRLVLVKPPEKSRFNFGAFSLGVLAAAVRRLCDISILDATDLPASEAVSRVLALDPDFVGVTAMGLDSVEPVAAFVRQVRRASAGGPLMILTGGHGASMLAARLLEAGADAVVIGEGELTLQEIIENGIRPGMPGTACLAGNEIVRGPVRAPIHPLDQLHPPARDLMPPPPDGIHLMESSRGCPHACAFCETTRFYGRRWRPHSAQWVAEEVRRLVEEYEAWVIHIADDNFAASPRRVLKICEQLQRGPLPAFLMASARADDLLANPRVLPMLVAARIQRISVGVETTEPEVAARVGKPIPRETYREAFARMREQGMFSVASFIVGLPGETAEMRERAVELAVEVAPDSAHFLPFLPLPGIPLASNWSGCDPDPADVSAARLFDEAFFAHPVVQRRLAEAAAGDGIRGLLARATLKRQVGTNHIY